MESYEKIYIGKGKLANEEFNIVEVSISMEKAEPHIFEYKEKKYLKFEVSARKEPDQYGNTHNVYLSKKVTEEPKAKKSK
jgi:hypothetical protein